MTVRKYFKLTPEAIQSEWAYVDAGPGTAIFENQNGVILSIPQRHFQRMMKETEVRITMSVDELNAERNALRGELHESDGNIGS